MNVKVKESTINNYRKMMYEDLLKVTESTLKSDVAMLIATEFSKNVDYSNVLMMSRDTLSYAKEIVYSLKDEYFINGINNFEYKLM